MPPRKDTTKRNPGSDSPAAVDRLFSFVVEPNFISVVAAIKLMVETMKDISTSLDFQSKSFDEMLNESKKQTKLMDTLKTELIACKKENAELKVANVHLNNKLNDLEQYSKNYNLEIQGVPVTQGEDVYKIVADIAKKIGCDVAVGDIELCHRMRSNEKKPNSVPNIIAKFYSRRCKEAILSCKKGKKQLVASEIGFNNANKIYVNEHLTSVNKNLFWLARNTRAIGYKYIWTKNGRVFVRKNENEPVIRIVKPDDVPER